MPCFSIICKADTVRYEWYGTVVLLFEWMQMRLVGWLCGSLTSAFSTNTAISETNRNAIQLYFVPGRLSLLPAWDGKIQMSTGQLVKGRWCSAAGGKGTCGLIVPTCVTVCVSVLVCFSLCVIIVFFSDCRIYLFSSLAARVFNKLINLLVTRCHIWALYTPFTQYNRLSIRLYNRFDNRLYRVNKHATGCQNNRLHVCVHDTTGCQAGLTTSCIVQTGL